MRKYLIFVLLCVQTSANSDPKASGPYLQLLTSSSVSIQWEAKIQTNASLTFQAAGDDAAQTVQAEIVDLPDPAPKLQRLYIARLTELKPGTNYIYSVSTEGLEPSTHSFTSPPEDVGDFSFLAMSDAQDGFRVTERNLRESIIPRAFHSDLLAPSFAVFAGDLVQNGDRYAEWQQHWFQPMASLLNRIPVYPAPGNHEKNNPLYFTYFSTPENGTPGYIEHWYSFDFGNTRFISLDTNDGYRIQEQLDWLSLQLDEAAADDRLAFVIAYFHHPFKSEAWIPGELGYSGRIQSLLEDFSLKTDKPSFHLCGHTHGYSRGHSYRARHSMISVAAVGGAIDDWGDYKQQDYSEYVKSLANFGWMHFSIRSGENPTITLRRFGFGDDRSQVDQGLVDSYTIKRFNQAPLAPQVIGASFDSKGHLNLKLGTFEDPDGDSHLTTHVRWMNTQTGEQVGEFFQNNENWYMGKNLEQGRSLLEPSPMVPDRQWTSLSYQVRFRDSSMTWSDWADVAAAQFSENQPAREYP